MTPIFNYLDKLFSHPEEWDLQQMVHKEALTHLIDAYADAKPRSLDQILIELYREFPYLKDNTEIIEMGNTLYSEVIESLKATAADDPNGTEPLPELNEDRAKLLERKIVLFNKVVEMRRGMQEIGLHITGAGKASQKTLAEPGATHGDRPGTAQHILKSR